MLRRNFFLLFFAFLLSLRLAAQSEVTGTVMDKTTKQPLELATVQLLHEADSTITAFTVTNRRGKFILENIAAGNYRLRCSFIGYEKTEMVISISSKQTTHHAGEIGMIQLSSSLKEVTVTARKPMLNTGIDRKVYNVSQDIMSQGGSASDILKNIPSLEVDIEGQVSLRGSTDVTILINGRPSPLMGRSRAEALQQLPANSIERIEIITNPSARYRPDGSSGIINIVLKKNIKSGFNGSITTNAGNRDRYNGNISLNYKPGKFNLSGSYGVRKDNRMRQNEINREYPEPNGSTWFDENNQSYFRPLSHFVMLGADYELSDRNSFGTSFNYLKRTLVRNDVANKFFYDNSRVLTDRYDRLRYGPELETEKDVTVYWQHNFVKEDEELRVEFNASTSDEEEDNHFTDINIFPAAPSAFDNTLIRTGDNQQQLTVDYSSPLAEDSKLEVGYAGSFMQQDLDFYGEYFDTAQAVFVKDLVKSNRFLYNESVHAVYSTYQRSYEKFSYELGLRAELVNFKGDLVTKDSLVSNDYFKIFPTLHLAYMLKNGELQLNYSRRINRPEGDELNPFPEYQDPLNLRAGNPKLLPEIIHSVEFGYKWQNKNFSFVPSLYYRYRQHGFTTVIIPLNDSVLLTTEENLSNDQSAGLELILSAKAGTFFNANLSSNIFYNQIDASDLGYSNKKSIVTLSTNFNSTFSFAQNTMMQASCNFRSARLTPQGKVYPSFVFNAGMRQDLFKKKLSITLTVSDFFKTQRQKTEYNTTYLKQLSVGRRDARVIYLGISYRFGKTIKKQDEEKLQFDDSMQ